MENAPLTPNNVSAGSDKKVYWQCKKNPLHVWEAHIYSRTAGRGCPHCARWTTEHMRLLLRSIIQEIGSLSPAELFVFFQKSGSAESSGDAKRIAQAIQSNIFSIQDIQNFTNGDPSAIDEFLQNNQKKDLFSFEIAEGNTVAETAADNSFFNSIPTIQSKKALETLDKITSIISDEEAIKFFVNSAAQKIWQHASVSENEALAQVNAFGGGIYPQEVKKTFLQEYYGAKNIPIPNNFSFKQNGKYIELSLMQRLTCYKVLAEKRVGNWSGPGAGKTLSAIITSRVINASVSVIICPHNVIPVWLKNIPEAFPLSNVFTKSDDHWNKAPLQYPKYLVLNYEFFQQDNCQLQLNNFLQTNKVDFCILDEIHFSKQREKTKSSIRKLNVSWFLQQMTKINPSLYVLGMTATPVINNLYEGKTLLEMIKGTTLETVETKNTLNNCMFLYQVLRCTGIRILPTYSSSLSIILKKINADHLFLEIKQLGKNQDLKLEALLTQAKLPTLVQELCNKTIIYTQYIGAGILESLKKAVSCAGYTYSVFTGKEKESLDQFIKGDVAVLIASKPISTGIDGLQNVCSRIIINSLPWTNAEFEQLVGRIYRQGQIKDRVEIIIPIISIKLSNNRIWSWCQMRYDRIKFKRTIADAAVDGIIPDEKILSREQAFTCAMSWLKKLESE